METWTFYSRRLFLFARLSCYFIAVLRLTKSSTLLSALVLASTQQVFLVVIENITDISPPNGHRFTPILHHFTPIKPVLTRFGAKCQLQFWSWGNISPFQNLGQFGAKCPWGILSFGAKCFLAF